MERNSNGRTLVVWGGSSAVGMCAIQMAKAAGYVVAATASPHNFETLREIGADFTFDYHEEGVVDEIVSALQGQGESAGVFVAMVGLDPAAGAATLIKIGGLADRLGGRKHIGTVFPPAIMPSLPLPEGVSMSTNTCSDIRTADVGKAVWADWLAGALDDGTMKCKPDAEVVGQGLESIQKAVDLVGKGVSATKLVVELP